MNSTLTLYQVSALRDKPPHVYTCLTFISFDILEKPTSQLAAIHTLLNNIPDNGEFINVPQIRSSSGRCHSARSQYELSVSCFEKSIVLLISSLLDTVMVSKRFTMLLSRTYRMNLAPELFC
jgi:hypothetical protein